MKATFGGGCFWCTEAIFKNVRGVSSIQPGYMGGKNENPTYEEVCTGKTDHVEVIEIEYDSEVTRFEELLKVFFETHDPTTLNRQGNDIGTQYRSVVFYHDVKQQNIAEEMISYLQENGAFPNPIVTSVEPAQKFWLAEDYHFNYFERNPQNQYCALVVAPKVKKFLESYNARDR